ncbi:ESPR domain-containing protein [Pluralibacter gergoviae]|nr:ESPR domain-containing protein [Pluralibacter gergoviae]
MNKIYIVIWNAALSLWVVSSELGKGKKSQHLKLVVFLHIY